MPLPTALDIQERSQVDFGALGFGTTGQLQRLVNVSVALFGRFTGQGWRDDGTYTDAAPAAGTGPLAEDAIESIVEVLAYRKQEERSETLSDFDLLITFSAGNYSETRRSADDALKAAWVVWGALLRPLMDYAHIDEWLEIETNAPAPAWESQEVDWTRGAQHGETAATWDPYRPVDPWFLGREF